MFLFLLAYIGGVLTIVSPCILPVLPFVFARAGQPFLKSTLPMLVGMAATFAAVATLAAFGGGWAVQANEYGRYAAMALLAAFGVILLFPSLADHLTRPIVAFGARLSQTSDRESRSGGSIILASALLGVATGLLWAPCAGPILGLILTGAALQGASLSTTVLLLAYALGAATSLAFALLIGGRVYQAMKRSLGIGEWVRRGLGVLVLVAVVAISFGLDTGFLTQASLAGTASLEQGLIDTLHDIEGGQSPSVVMGHDDTRAMMSGDPGLMMQVKPTVSTESLPIERLTPSLDGSVQWLNSPALSMKSLKGKVVLIDFWTYSCINCIRAIPYVKAWAKKYKDQGLVVIGVHAPEFAFEKKIANVEKAVKDIGISYPVAIDNDYAIWRAFENQYWPAHYFIDAQGRVRHHHFGEGEYGQSEKVIQQLLSEKGEKDVAGDIVKVNATGAQAASDRSDVQSPETYVGWQRSENFVDAKGTVNDMAHAYTAAEPLLNQWGLTGNWTVNAENAALNDKGGSIYYRFHARDLHLVLGPGTDGKPVRFTVTIDGKAPGDSHGTDTDADGNGTVTDQRLYQLVRQVGSISDHTFEIRFNSSNVQAYAFTFG